MNAVAVSPGRHVKHSRREVLEIAPGPRRYRWTYVTVGAWLLDAGKDALEDRLESARGRAASEPPASRHSVPCAMSTPRTSAPC